MVVAVCVHVRGVGEVEGSVFVFLGGASEHGGAGVGVFHLVFRVGGFDCLY